MAVNPYLSFSTSHARDNNDDDNEKTWLRSIEYNEPSYLEIAYLRIVHCRNIRFIIIIALLLLFINDTSLLCLFSLIILIFFQDHFLE